MILIFGAAGDLGRRVTQALLQHVPANQLRLASRQPERLDHSGAETVYADFGEPESLAAAMQGVSKVLLISGDAPNDVRLGQHLAVIQAAKSAGVEQLVYTSFQLANLDSAFDFARSHGATEAALRLSGVPFTLVRNGLYAELTLMGLEQALQKGERFNASGSGRFAPVLKDDLAEALAKVLTEPGHVGQTYTLQGPELFSQAGISALIADISGKALRTVDISPEAQQQTLLAMGLPEFLARALAGNSRAIANDEYLTAENHLPALLGRTPGRLETLLRQALSH
ncbi:NAD(P)H-binding protein [Shewanella cyperi]|uniref:NAD(P)H-binding protein n=1 Tax=Shewanella cyperi TaxID=2814292 RepID=UPI001A948672|nr:NAD(P)H-binding protein [Shewanella cyperi]QSX40808.1 NAD(P)H-binding protein [Shewanella cyperi]